MYVCHFNYITKLKKMNTPSVVQLLEMSPNNKFFFKIMVPKKIKKLILTNNYDSQETKNRSPDIIVIQWRMNGKCSANSFLFGSSSLANHGG